MKRTIIVKLHQFIAWTIYKVLWSSSIRSIEFTPVQQSPISMTHDFNAPSYWITFVTVSIQQISTRFDMSKKSGVSAAAAASFMYLFDEWIKSKKEENEIERTERLALILFCFGNVYKKKHAPNGSNRTNEEPKKVKKKGRPSLYCFAYVWFMTTIKTKHNGLIPNTPGHILHII